MEPSDAEPAPSRRPAEGDPASLRPPPAPELASRAELAELARRAGLRRIGMLAWRDLDDPEAGGSELHAHEIASRWAAAGVDVIVRTSAVAGQAVSVERAGYRVVRRSGRYAVFVTGPVDFSSARYGRLDGVVEIWNGMPFLSPLWARVPSVVFMHHVHAEMWSMALPRALAAAGNLMESRLAPPVYRHARIVTLSASSRREIVALPGISAPRVSVVEPGIDSRFCPGGQRSDRPLIVAVGRLVPVKSFHRLVKVVATVREEVPDVELVIAGEGYQRSNLESAIAEAGARSFTRLAGRLDEDELVALYRRAWVVASTSTHEGWGMTISEAAACGTPAVATRIAGHLDAIDHGRTGLLASTDAELVAHLRTILSDAVLRRRLGRAAMARASHLTWDATASGTLAVLSREAERRPSRQASSGRLRS